MKKHCRKKKKEKKIPSERHINWGIQKNSFRKLSEYISGLSMSAVPYPYNESSWEHTWGQGIMLLAFPQ